MTTQRSGGILSAARRAALRTLGFDPLAAESRLQRLEGEISDLREELARARAAAAGQSQQAIAGTEWRQQAQSHLQALQGAYEELRELAARVQLEVQRVVAGQAAAEAHLAGLQTESERARSTARRCEEQLAEAIEHSSRHGTRLAGLEDSVSEIVEALARSSLPPAPE